MKTTITPTHADGRRVKISGIRTYLDGVKSQVDRSRIRRGYIEQLAKRSEPHRSPMNRRRRECLHDAIFSVENNVESQAGGRPDHPRVVAMRYARNLVADDLGWNVDEHP